MTIVAKVWIDEDCITCDACQDICPEVFEVNDDSSQILAAVRTDGKFDRNVGGSPMVGSLGADYGEMILEAAEACPVEVIKFELVSDGAEIAVEVAPAAELAVEAAPAAAVATGGSEAFQSLMGGDRSLAIFFGSQTGNAAGLAEKTAKMAADYGLVPTVYDMDGFDASKLNSHPRTLIITSTWGEGEMPDNAETLWNTVSSGKPSLANVHFSVCAIGDSSYDEFCKAGTDWDDKYVELGASRIHEIQLCDVDFDTPYGHNGFLKPFRSLHASMNLEPSKRFFSTRCLSTDLAPPMKWLMATLHQVSLSNKTFPSPSHCSVIAQAPTNRDGTPSHVQCQVMPLWKIFLLRFNKMLTAALLSVVEAETAHQHLAFV